jgi:hypothetical protein
VFDAICINVSETDQANVAVMVTLGAPQCMNRAKPKSPLRRQFGGRGCTIMVIEIWPSRAACQFETACKTRRRARILS